VVAAVALGARAVLIGRPYLYGLMAGGGPGVRRALEILRGETERTMQLLGAPSVADLGRASVSLGRKSE
jgi:L-lactate dehydrogenase (cytochrome)